MNERTNTKRISMKSAVDRPPINNTDRLNDFILGEIGTGTRTQDTIENSNQRQLVFCRDVKQVLKPSE